MRLAEWTGTRGMRLALGAVVLGLGACAYTYLRATDIKPLPPIVASTDIVAGALNAPAPSEKIDISRAVASNIFSPERQAPAKRYRLPWVEEPVAPVEPARPVVLGTGISGRGPFATVTLESPRVLFVYVGDHVGIYEVKSIDAGLRGKVVFLSSAGKEFEILAPRPGS